MSTKFCSKGNHEVAIELFSKSSSKRDGLFVWCKPCMALYEKERYHTGDRKRKEANKLKTLERNRDFIWNYLSEHPCIDCDNTDVRVLQFDHINPSEKVFNVSAMLWGYSQAMIQTEISKCVVRCSNCHIIRTNEQFGYWKVERFEK